MKNAIAIVCLMWCMGSLHAQNTSRQITEYAEFKPAVIHLMTGRDVTITKANIFLKNSRLLYKSGTKTKQARTANVKSVDFADRTYVRIDTLLAYPVDTVGTNTLYCARMIDMAAFNAMIINNRQITDLSIGEQVGMTTLELINEENVEYPIVNHYFFSYRGKVVRAQDREVLRLTPKPLRRNYWTVVRENGFSWDSEASLMKLLKAITEGGQ